MVVFVEKICWRLVETSGLYNNTVRTEIGAVSTSGRYRSEAQQSKAPKDPTQRKILVYSSQLL